MRGPGYPKHQRADKATHRLPTRQVHQGDPRWVGTCRSDQCLSHASTQTHIHMHTHAPLTEGWIVNEQMLHGYSDCGAAVFIHNA